MIGTPSGLRSTRRAGASRELQAGEPANHEVARAVALLAGFAAAVGIRAWAGQPQVSQSASAGLLFAVLLLIPVAALAPRERVSPRGLAVGLAGAAVLCLPVVARADLGQHRPAGSFATWAVVVAVVAVAEELFLRGLLYSAVERLAGPVAAVAVAAVAFGLLHVPLYGWRAVPLDVAVGVWLGVLRRVTGGPGAPAVAHTLADFAGWWLR